MSLSGKTLFVSGASRSTGITGEALAALAGSAGAA